MARKSTKRNYLDIAYSAADHIGTLPEGTELNPAIALFIAAAFEGNRDAWAEYDNRLWQRRNFHLARQLRNSPSLHHILFDSFR